MSASGRWIFGYGSLIWKPELEFLDRRPALLKGWSRRFWQGSHDHRGTPDAPGRVVTLVPEANAVCAGMAYLIDERVLAASLKRLDHREKNGYARLEVSLELDDDEVVVGLVYIALENNEAYLGPAPMCEIAEHIRRSHGPSGANLEYLLSLATALRDLDVSDDHVFELERLVSPSGGVRRGRR
ncbi:MAG: gamma-glutamylcyclotransferase [Thiotrichales bacterium]|nr:gamma-glutamylcyclotransferase [Thiotrichales bacterium]